MKAVFESFKRHVVITYSSKRQSIFFKYNLWKRNEAYQNCSIINKFLINTIIRLFYSLYRFKHPILKTNHSVVIMYNQKREYDNKQHFWLHRNKFFIQTLTKMLHLFLGIFSNSTLTHHAFLFSNDKYWG